MSKEKTFNKSSIIIISGMCTLLSAVQAQETGDPYQLPYTEAYAPPINMLMSLSVEFPTGNTAAYKTKLFNANKVYHGYFEPNFCYKYKHYSGNGNSHNVQDEYFYPVRKIDPTSNGTRACGGSGEWSGNFLNWATMGVLDSFRWVLTGGKRTAEKPDETFLRRAWFDARGSGVFTYNQGNAVGDDNNFPDRYLTSDVVEKFTGLPRNKNWYIATLDPERYRHADRGKMPDVEIGDRFRIVEEGENTPYERGSWRKQRDRYYRVIVKVCSTPGLVENFCQQYPAGNFKPVGLIQRYADKARFGIFSYPLIDWTDSSPGWKGANIFQAGGVLRSPLKSIGQNSFNGTGWTANTQPEWNAQTGVLCENPDGSQPCPANGSSGAWGNSGSINYINQFGYRANDNGWHYKSSDPIAELYYESLRYYASNYSRGNPGMTSAYRYGNGRVNLDKGDPKISDGFPMITDNWKDPIINKCAKNNIVFLGDTNNNCDGRVPGGLFVNNPDDTIKCTDTNTSNLDVPEGTLNGRASALNVTAMLEQMGTFENLNLINMMGNPAWLNIACPNNGQWSVGRGCWMNMTLNIAGLAYWAHTRDIRPDLPDEQRVDNYFVDVHELAGRRQQGNPPAGKDPTQYWYAAKYGSYDLDIAERGKGRLNPNTRASMDANGLGQTVPAWDTDQDGVPDGWFEGSDTENIKNSLSQIFSRSTQNAVQITAKVAVESTEWSAQNQIFFPFYKVQGGVWFGDLYGKAADIPQDATFRDNNGELLSSSWSVSAQLDKRFDDVWKNNKIETPGAEKRTGGRQIIAGRSDGQKPTAFRWNELAAADRTFLSTSTDGRTAAAAAALGSARVDYIRGDHRQEIRFQGEFRNRPYGRMGAIANSSPLFVGPPEEGYSDSDFSKDTPSFSQFANQPRTGVVYVGADDGMLHAFNTSNGSEMFAYIPGMLMKQLPSLTHAPADYQHRLFVDGDLMVGNVMASGAWKTALIGTLGAGGKGFFVLDVTDPSRFAQAEKNPSSIVKLEVSPDTVPELGYIFHQPARNSQNRAFYTIGRVKWDANGTKRWVAFLGNGYGSKAKDGTSYVSLLVVDLESALNGDGRWKNGLVKPVSVTKGWDTKKANGLSTPTAIDTDFDGLVDTVYAGDQQGNLWKFDLSGKKDNKWNVATGSNNDAAPLFRARILSNGEEKMQPITTAPLVTTGCANPGYTISFGTGSVMDEAAIRSTVRNTFYTILDSTLNPWEPYQRVTRNQLLPQTITTEEEGYRYSSQNTIHYPNLLQTKGQRGWYLDLPESKGQPAERVIHTPLMYDQYLILSTYIPSDLKKDSCDALSGKGTLMALQICSGGSPSSPLFNSNGDDVVDMRDHGSRGDTVFASGKIYDGPVSLGEVLQKTTYTTTRDGKKIPQTQCQLINSKGSVGFACIPNKTKRLSWKEIRQYCVSGGLSGPSCQAVR